MGNSNPFYLIEGKKYDRITRVLDFFPHPDLTKWKLRVGPKEASRISKLALKVGSRVDDLSKPFLLKRSEIKIAAKDGLEVRNCIKGLQLFRLEHPEVKIVSCDKLVWDEELRIAGTMDIETEDAILDIKCAGKISLNYWLQVAIYNYMSGLNKPYLAILRLHKSLGIYEYQTIPYEKSLVTIFVGLLNAYRYYERTGIGGESGSDEDSDNDGWLGIADDEISKESEVAGPEVLVHRPGWNW